MISSQLNSIIGGRLWFLVLVGGFLIILTQGLLNLFLATRSKFVVLVGLVGGQGGSASLFGAGVAEWSLRVVVRLLVRAVSIALLVIRSVLVEVTATSTVAATSTAAATTIAAATVVTTLKVTIGV
jgi:hypothetical protein